MATRENSIPDSSQVDFNVLRPDVDQHNLETANSRIKHHLQIGVARERGFHREALASFNVPIGRNENLPRRSDR
jgi:hypothetical protein